MKRMLFGAGVAVCLIVAIGFGLWWVWGRSQGTQVVVLAHQINQPKVVNALVEEVRNFESLFPNIRVRLVEGADGDVAILNSYPTQTTLWKSPLTPWSGTLWVLGARTDRLRELESSVPAEVAALRAGALTPEAFETLVSAAKSAGPAPLTLGNSHLWPYALWLQAWTAATLGPDAATQLPTSVSGPYDAWSIPMAALKRWRNAGWFEESVWPQGWAQGLQPLETSATFAMLNEQLLSALSANARAKLGFFALPHRASDPPWSLGNAQFLAVLKTTPKAKEAETLVRYLSSPGVTSRLATATGRPFFAWNQATGRSPMVIGDWSARANTPEFQGLATALAK